MKCDKEKTTYTSISRDTVSAPKVYFTAKALKWISVIADMHEEEVGILGVVKKNQNDVYVIDDIFYPKHQAMNSGTCEISPEGESDMVNWLISKGREDDIENVRFWAHSHGQGGVSPSGQDEQQSIERMERNKAFFIRGIFNKRGILSVSFYDYDNKRRFDNVKWDTEPDEELSNIKAKVEELKKVNVPDTTTYRPSHGGWNDWRNCGVHNSGRGAHNYPHGRFNQPIPGMNHNPDDGSMGWEDDIDEAERTFEFDRQEFGPFGQQDFEFRV